MITATEVGKQYGSTCVLRDMSFRCESGRVTGLLGPNGAGKSTMMRIMTGLARPSSGTVTFDGISFAELPSPGQVAGVLLDGGAQHGGRTGAEVLRLGALTLGLPARRVRQVLDLVALSTAESRRRVKAYSLGMRQRLGIAHALLADPEVLILDEPANGLDPSGIRWIRELVAAHAAGGGTVLLSSHLIHEVELVADDLILVGGGQVLATGSKQDLLSRLQASRTVVSSEDNPSLHGLLVAAGHPVSLNRGRLVVTAEPGVVGRLAAEQQIALTELTSGGGNLEDEFFRLTDTVSRDPASSNPDDPHQLEGIVS